MKPEQYIKGFDAVQFILLHYKTHTIAQLADKTNTTQYIIAEICRLLSISPVQAKIKTVEVKRQPDSKIDYDKLLKHNKSLAENPIIKQQLATVEKQEKKIIVPASGTPSRNPLPFKRPPTEYTNIPSPYGLATEMLKDQLEEELKEKRKRKN